MPTQNLPALGLGTMGIDDADRIADALAAGYRHLDTAQIYDNEAVVGRGVARSAVDREDVFLATKVWADDLGADDVRETTEASLDRLGVDAVDLLYVHRPIEEYDPAATLPAFDRLREAGATRHVGVSNFTVDQLDAARETLDAPLFAHQVEMHPLYQQEELHAYARRHDHYLVAYSPLAQGEAFDLPAVSDVAEKHGATPAQVCLAWLAGKENVVPIPRSASPTHLRENLAARDLALDDEDVARIEAVDREKKLFE